MTTWRMNPGDTEIRELERRLAEGDPDAVAPLAAWLERTGNGQRLVELFHATGNMQAFVASLRLGMEPLNVGDQLTLTTHEIGLTTVPGRSTPDGRMIRQVTVALAGASPFYRHQAPSRAALPEVAAELVPPGSIEYRVEGPIGQRLHRQDALRVTPEGLVTYERRPFSHRLTTEEALIEGFTSASVLAMQWSPSIRDVALSLQKGDKALVGFGGETRVVEVLETRERETAGQPKIPWTVRSVYTSSGAGRGATEISVGANGGVRYQPTMRQEVREVDTLVKVRPEFKKARRKPVGPRPIKLGTKRSRELFSRILSGSTYSFDDMYGASDTPLDLHWAHDPDGLERYAMEAGVKSLRDDGGGKYTIHYHGNHWTSFEVGDQPWRSALPVVAPPPAPPPPPEPAWRGDIDPAVWPEGQPAPGPVAVEPVVEAAADPLDERAQAYRERIEAKRDRLLAAARRARARSGQLEVSARRMGDAIPMGQPILVGHHSEKRHRRDLARITGGFEKAWQEQERAEGLEAAAARIGTAGISSDDPIAVQRLEAELQQARLEHSIAKKANADMRRAMKGKAASREAHHAAIEQLDAPEPVKEKLRRTAFAFPWLPQFDMGQINQLIKRIEGRIAELQKEQTRPEVAPAQHAAGFTVKENRDLNRLQLVFHGKPGAKTRAALKRNGFRWSPNEGAWQRQLNEASRRAVDQVAAELGAHGGWQQNPF